MVPHANWKKSPGWTTWRVECGDSSAHSPPQLGIFVALQNLHEQDCVEALQSQHAVSDKLCTLKVKFFRKIAQIRIKNLGLI